MINHHLRKPGKGQFQALTMHDLRGSGHLVREKPRAIGDSYSPIEIVAIYTTTQTEARTCWYWWYYHIPSYQRNYSDLNIPIP